MNEQDKQEQARLYEAAKRRGEPFYPNAVIRDALVALVVFLILVGLSAFFKAELQAPANPSDSSYVPRPEWYFLFLYEILKFLPGSLVIIGVIVLPAVVFAILFLLPWLDRSKERHPRKRPLIMALLTFAWVNIIGFTVLAFVSAPRQTEITSAVAGINQQQASAGQDLFLNHCAGCHGVYGEGGPNPIRAERIIPPISSHSFLVTFTNDTLFNIIANGLPDRGMAAFSQRNGGPLDDARIDQLVSFIRRWETDPPVVPSDADSAETLASSASQGDAVRGMMVFASLGCPGCHGSTGTLPVGTNRVSIVAPAYLASKSDAQLIAIIHQGFPAPQFMRAYRGLITPQAMSDLLAWLRSHK